MADKLKKAGVQFVIEPYIRFKGEVGEQGTMFFLDPSGNAIEFKAMAQPDRLFAK
jgi:extradiol dioxygenase family protein